MTDADVSALIEQYRAGLDAEIVLLRRLEAAAAAQREAAAAHDLRALNRAADDRDSLMAGLVTMEGQLREVRQALWQSRDRARRLPGYAEAADLHHAAIALVGQILRSDAESLDALATAELARRNAVRAMEQGETTLAAYRRVMTAVPGATLVDRLG